MLARSTAALSAFTVEQWGMVTAAQARSVGVSRVAVARLIAAGVLEAMPGAARVYRLAGAPPDPERDDIRAVWLQLGDTRPASERLRSPDAIVTGRSAAVVLGVGDLRAPVHELYVTRRRQLRRADTRLRLRADVSDDDWRTVDGLPTATVARVVADLLTEREDASAVARICQDAASRGLLGVADLAAVVGPHARAYGAGAARVLVEALLGPDSLGGSGPDIREDRP